jgi:two-component system response regulator FixJ
MCATIAIVDDDEAILDSIQLLLESECWTARLYGRGRQLLEDLSDQFRPDCVILDPHLPDISGSEVVRHISDIPLQIPIIVWTAQPQSSQAREVLQAGIQVMLIKPVATEVLIKEIRVAIGNSQR